MRFNFYAFPKLDNLLDALASLETTQVGQSVSQW